MIQISPNAIGDLGKRILSNICKNILNQSSEADDDERSMLFSHGHFTLLPDEPHADPEISADTRVKVKELFFFVDVNLDVVNRF